MAKKKRKNGRKVRIGNREVLVQEEPGGTGLTAIIRGDTQDEVWNMVTELQYFAMMNDLEQVEVMSVQPSPAGGWEAVVRAHNFNVLKALGKTGAVAKDIAKKVGKKGKEKLRGYTEDEYCEALEELRAEGITTATPGMVLAELEERKAREAEPSVAKTKKDIQARITKKQREAQTRREVEKYGIETKKPTEVREVPVVVPQYDSEGRFVCNQIQIVTTKTGGRELSQEELMRKIEKAKKERPTKTKRFAEGTKKVAKAAHELGTETAIGVGRRAGKPFAPGAFRRGSQTFAVSGVPPASVAFTPTAQQRLMAASILQGPQVVGGLKPLPLRNGSKLVTTYTEPLPITPKKLRKL